LEKVAQNTKILTAKLNLKAPNLLHIKLQMKHKNTCHKPCVETACLGENWLSKK
jgi:hypothetical protein